MKSETEILAALVSVQAHYFFPTGAKIPTLEIHAERVNDELAVTWKTKGSGGSFDGHMKGSRFAILESLNDVVGALVAADKSVIPPYPLSLNIYSSFIGEPRLRPFAGEFLYYWLSPQLTFCVAKLAVAARNAADPDAASLARYARDLFTLGATELSLGTEGDDPYSLHAKNNLDIKAIENAVLAGLTREKGNIHNIIEEASNAAHTLTSQLKTQSVLKAFAYRVELIEKHIGEPEILIALATDLEWLIYHDISEVKNIRKVQPLFSKILKPLLNHQDGSVRRRFHFVAGLWLNFHLFALEECAELRRQVFEDIVHDCPMLSLSGITQTYEELDDKQGILKVEAMRPTYLHNPDLEAKVHRSKYRPPKSPKPEKLRNFIAE